MSHHPITEVSAHSQTAESQGVDSPAEPLNVRIRRARELAGLTTKQAGERFDRTPSWINQFENGTIRIYPRRLDDLLAVYGLRVELVPADSQATHPPVLDSPLTCRFCRNSPATQAFVTNHPAMGVDVALICGPCGDWSEPHALPFTPVWRYTLTPVLTGGE